MKRFLIKTLAMVLTFSLLIGFSVNAYAKEAAPCGKDLLNSQNTMLCIIDVQKIYIPGYPGALSGPIPGQDMEQKLANVKKMMQLAQRTELKTLVTYEWNNIDMYDMPEDLKSELPTKNIEQFNKEYYDITKKPEISTAFDKAGIKNIIVCGAETDVCVLQSVMGLIKKGFNVFLADDATYTSTTLNSPALKRMELAGARLVKTEDVVKSVEGFGKLDYYKNPGKDKNYIDMVASKEAIVVANFDDESFEAVNDPKKDAKLLRIQHLSQYAEILDMPAYFIYDGSIEKVKPYLNNASQVHFIKAEKSIQKSLKDVMKSLKEQNITQVAVGGIDEKNITFDAAKAFENNRFDVHFLEDSVFETGGVQDKDLNSLYRHQVIPSSLKIFFYDTTEHITTVPAAWLDRMIPKYEQGLVVWVDLLPFVKDSQ
ncbi:MAG: isochorismatase family protein [Clostridia bacterium]|nr:isochorismatase family protein [Clostridia bacterium]